MELGLSRAEALNEDGHGLTDDDIRERCIEDVESEFAVASLVADLKKNLPFASHHTVDVIMACHVDALAYARAEKEHL